MTLNEIVMKCLSKQPNERYARANDLADVLIKYLSSSNGSSSALRDAAAARAAAK